MKLHNNRIEATNQESLSQFVVNVTVFNSYGSKRIEATKLLQSNNKNRE